MRSHCLRYISLTDIQVSATLDREREQESGRLREAARAEEARVQEELAKRQARNRHISQSANAVPDVEQGATTSTT